MLTSTRQASFCQHGRSLPSPPEISALYSRLNHAYMHPLTCIKYGATALALGPAHSITVPRVAASEYRICVSIIISAYGTTLCAGPRPLYCMHYNYKRIKLAIFFKMLRSKVMVSFAHFVGVRRSCRALQFILTVTEAAIATQKPNGKLNTAC